MKKTILILITMLLLVYAFNAKKVTALEEENITENNVTENSNEEQAITTDSSNAIQPKNLEEMKQFPEISNINIEYYINNSAEAIDKTAENYPAAEAERIAFLCIDYYMTYNPFVDEKGIPRGLSDIRIYELPGREDWIVISGDVFFRWPGCFIFLYKKGELVVFPDDTAFQEITGFAEEIRLIYGPGFPYPLIEIAEYSHQNNGEIGTYWLDNKNLKSIMGESVMGHYTTYWGERRESAIFDGLKLGEYFGCLYKDKHLTPSYEDVNQDGYIDIVFSGYFECEDGDYNILLSQEVKRVFLYDESKEQYVINLDLCVRSELEEYWLSDIALKMDEWTKNNQN